MLDVQVHSFDYDGRLILKDIFFKVNKGEHIALMGESGSGKSTLLKIIYGLLHLKEGSIFWGEKQALGPNYNLVPGEPYMKYLSQDFDLMPFTTVEENIAEHLSVFTRETHADRITELLEMIEMKDYAKTKVKNLSGGQQQRIALAKVLAQEPEVLLLDEPFGHIDNFKRNALRYNLFPYLRNKGITVITASHDPNDVLSYCDRILVIKDGKCLANHETQLLYQNPPNFYIASLFGEVNQVPIRLLKSYAPLDTSVLIYPHEFKISKESGLKVEITKSQFRGSHFLVEGETKEGYSLRFNSNEEHDISSSVYLNISLETINLRLKPKEAFWTKESS
ncbi:ABC transporter ATP-binding protein [Flagellimonas meridianipacifica]|uniref:ABC-type Fe3+/spermidine/putrescine transport system ATPase subunit n=1 Tax=Flagellimonas meridianipacifica TaxID=1080225 RepID=A0A2T0MGW6_9FLAO|nr:ABC transporter ATP-binding protein [Allomuricauda pacifica]PRX56821.1 ABC-type Fe3+/spermidine/putrescine transport system ATPase subunit [Allomuricauda pacifica]